MNNRRLKRGSLLTAGGSVLIIAAFLLTASNVWEEKRAEKYSDDALSEMSFAKPLSSEEAGEEVIPDYILNPDMEMPSEEIDGYRYIGKIEIPSAGLSLPVIKEWSYKALKKAPCCYFGSIYKSNMVIAGHNYKRHFGVLKNLLPGDEVIFTDIDGNVFSYEVCETETLSPDKISEMTSGEYPLTLFTCTPGGKSRVSVRCGRVI